MEGVSRTAAACPVSGERLDERAVRFVAWITVVFLLLYLIVGLRWIPLFLLVDFSMRGIFSRKWAPLALLARRVVKRFDFGTKKLINAAPKIFAARLGVLFSALLLLFQLIGFQNSLPTYIVGIMFLTAAFLEAAFAFCLGCRIYQLIQRLKSHPFGHGEGI